MNPFLLNQNQVDLINFLDLPPEQQWETRWNNEKEFMNMIHSLPNHAYVYNGEGQIAKEYSVKILKDYGIL